MNSKKAIYVLLRFSLSFSVIPIVMDWMLAWANEGEGIKSLVEMIFTPILWVCFIPVSIIYGGVSNGAEGVFEQVIGMFVLGVLTGLILVFIKLKRAKSSKNSKNQQGRSH